MTRFAIDWYWSVFVYRWTCPYVSALPTHALSLSVALPFSVYWTHAQIHYMKITFSIDNVDSQWEYRMECVRIISQRIYIVYKWNITTAHNCIWYMLGMTFLFSKWLENLLFSRENWMLNNFSSSFRWSLYQIFYSICCIHRWWK